MASWVTHLMIADGVLEHFPWLDRRGFCVGNIAPDCNVENEDWTAFTPPRAVTHWMSGERKQAADCDAFCRAYILERLDAVSRGEEYSFLLGYYAHLITDAAFQAFIRDEQQVRAAWRRVMADEALRERSVGMTQDRDALKRLIPKQQRMGEIYSIEARYLKEHPNSGFLTEILPLKEFPDYIDYLPHGCVVRKIGVMGFVPREDDGIKRIVITGEEYSAFVSDTIALVADRFRAMGLV